MILKAVTDGPRCEGKVGGVFPHLTSTIEAKEPRDSGTGLGRKKNTQLNLKYTLRGSGGGGGRNKRGASGNDGQARCGVSGSHCYKKIKKGGVLLWVFRKGGEG